MYAWSSETGLVYGWGLGLNGRLGNEYEGIVQEPQVMECFKEASLIGMRVISVSCGENHTLALVDMGLEGESRKLFVWGSNDKWQLGMENRGDTGGGEEGQGEEGGVKEVGVPHQLDPDPF